MIQAFVFLGLGSFLLIVWVIVCSIISVTDSPHKIKKYEVRYEPKNNKYYIVRTFCYLDKEERIRGRLRLTIYYKDISKASYVCELLNKDYSAISGNTEL
ncbi:hypothetical protein [Escherichia phage vB_EcoM_JNE01]|nr:hypothetical protein [Escherichia phage vB_EcoM_JNE01]